jgi:transcriptional regulator GlxA family with amidase domain
MTGRTDVREAVFAVYDDMQRLDLAGPLDVFDAAAKITGGRYRMRTASLGGAPVVCSSGVRLGVDADLAARLWGDLRAQSIQLFVEYAPQPPFSAGSLETAPPEVVAELGRMTAADA